MGYNKVKFTRPGQNGVKECVCEDGTTIEEALEQASIDINKTKEAVFEMDEDTMETNEDPCNLSDEVENGVLYAILPQVASA